MRNEGYAGELWVGVGRRMLGVIRNLNWAWPAQCLSRFRVVVNVFFSAVEVHFDQLKSAMISGCDEVRLVFNKLHL